MRNKTPFASKCFAIIMLFCYFYWHLRHNKYFNNRGEYAILLKTLPVQHKIPKPNPLITARLDDETRATKPTLKWQICISLARLITTCERDTPYISKVYRVAKGFVHAQKRQFIICEWRVAKGNWTADLERLTK